MVTASSNCQKREVSNRKIEDDAKINVIKICFETGCLFKLFSGKIIFENVFIISEKNSIS